MMRIAISRAAFDAIARTMPFGSVNFEAGVDANGERLHLAPARGCRSACVRCADLVRASATSFGGWGPTARPRREGPQKWLA